MADPGGTLHDAIERWLRRAERVGYEPGGADDLLAALREHLSAHPEDIVDEIAQRMAAGTRFNAGECRDSAELAYECLITTLFAPPVSAHPGDAK